jgi:Zn-dependent M28 family amino/carboxypeptidase
MRRKNMVRSFLRITVATAVIVGIGFTALAIVLRQPIVTTLPFRGTVRADASLLRKHVAFLTEDVCPRSASHPDNLDRAAAYIERAFRDAHGVTSVQTFAARGRHYTNVITRFGPDDANLPVLVIGAHYDSFGETGNLPGADDNASGTAGLLELARLLGRHTLARPVELVAFTTEEPPFFGSQQMGSAVHAQSLVEQGRVVRGMICLEMIGYFSNEQAWPNELFALLYPSRGDFIGVVGGWDDRELTRVVKRAMAGAGTLPIVSFTGPQETSDASDQRNYWSRGWKAVMVTDTAFLRNPNYHTRGDTAGTLDYERMAQVVDGVLNATLHDRSR